MYDELLVCRVQNRISDPRAGGVACPEVVGGDVGGSHRPGRRRFVRGTVAMYLVSCNESFYVAAPAAGCTVEASAGRPPRSCSPCVGAAHHVMRHRVQPVALAEHVARHRRRTGLCAFVHVLRIHVLNAEVRDRLSAVYRVLRQPVHRPLPQDSLTLILFVI